VYQSCQGAEFWRTMNQEFGEDNVLENAEVSENNASLEDSGTKLIGE
jgi:hypothetical protein